MHRDGERARVRRRIAVLVEQQRGLERPPPRRRELGQHLRRAIREEVAERRVGEPLLGLRGSGAEHAERPLPGGLDAGRPERRLADPGLAFEDERSRAAVRPVEEGVQRCDLVLPADDLHCHPGLC